MTAPLREQPSAAVHASPTANALLDVGRSVVVSAVVVGGFFAFVGAYGSYEIPIGPRLAFMIGVSLVATVLGHLAFVVAEKWPWACRPFWRLGLTATLLMFAPMGLVVWLGMQLTAWPGAAPPVGAIPAFLATSAGTTAFFCFTAAFFRRPARREGAPAALAPPKFLERLPLKLRGAEVWAVEAEDHYLRLHTSKGQDLILLRLADAVAELEGIEGAQVHRSWWVSRDAVTGARRGDGRATLTLKDGSEVPVSRTYARLLRDRGWI